MRVKVLVLPVYRRHWIYHAWIEGDPERAHVTAASAVPWWQKGTRVEDKVQALTTTVNRKVNNFIVGQWGAMAAAQEGSFRNWMFRLATTVLSKEDPVESFLKQLPSQGSAGLEDILGVEVIYPASLNATLVRRRLRHVALRNTQHHRRGLLGWWLACIPQAPLMLTPLPNVTVYYSIYRALSHQRALAGATTLHSAFDNPSSGLLQKCLQRALVEQPKKQRRGGLCARGGMAADEERMEMLLRQLYVRTTQPLPSPSLALDNTVKGSHGRKTRRPPVIVLVPSLSLDQAVQPLERWRTPLEDDVVPTLPMVRAAAGQQGVQDSWPGADTNGFSTSSFLEHLGRVRKRAVEAEAARDRDRAAAFREKQGESNQQ